MIWQTIDTAPMNNHKVLLLVWEGEWRHPRRLREVRFGFNGRPINNYRTEEGEAYEVTHWMPLPPPPEEKIVILNKRYSVCQNTTEPNKPSFIVVDNKEEKAVRCYTDRLIDAQIITGCLNHLWNEKLEGKLETIRC